MRSIEQHRYFIQPLNLLAVSAVASFIHQLAEREQQREVSYQECLEIAERFHEDDQYRVYVSTDHADVTGCIVARKIPEYGEDCWEIGTFFVASTAQRSTAQRLMLRITGDLLKMGAKTFIITRHGSKTVGLKLKLIERLGFKEILNYCGVTGIKIFVGDAHKVTFQCFDRMSRFWR